MRPVLKKIAIALVVLLLIAGGVVYYLWQQATALPDWYTEGALEEYAGEPTDEPAAAPRWIALDEQGNRIPDAEPVPLPPPFAGSADEPSSSSSSSQQPPPPAEAARGPKPPPTAAPARPRSRPVDPRTKRHELRGFHIRRGRNGKRKQNPAVKASRAVYEEGHLEIGFILDLSRLPKDKLKKKDRARYERAIANFPGITQRDVWVGVDDRPITVDGYLQLSSEAEFRVGKLTYSLASAAERMGMSQFQMRAELNRELRRLGFVDPEA